MQSISARTKLHALLDAYPFLEAFLVAYHPKFGLLHNRVMRATVGRVASLGMVASVGGVDLDKLLRDIAAEVRRQTNAELAVETAQGADLDAERLEILKGIIKDLHDGGELATAQERFALAIKDIEPSEIARLEQSLIAEGMPVSEVQRLCDVHVGAMRSALDGHGPVSVPAGHPVHTLLQDNLEIRRIATELKRLAELLGAGDESARPLLAAWLGPLGSLDNHYVRKENQLFPVLEQKGIDGPTKVMWGVHDEIRAALKAATAAAASAPATEVAAVTSKLADAVLDMIYKEEKILFPMALAHIDDAEWRRIRAGEDALGYALAKPGSDWPGIPLEPHPVVATAADSALLALRTGALSLEQLNLILCALPLDISFIDEHDVVRFYSDGKRHFPRSPEVIGRKVQNCHPPKSVGTVQRIIDAFRAGERDVAAFWIQHHGAFLHIRYLALRDAQGTYRGCLEVGQDLAPLRALEGEQRLLDWK